MPVGQPYVKKASRYERIKKYRNLTLSPPCIILKKPGRFYTKLRPYGMTVLVNCKYFNESLSKVFSVRCSVFGSQNYTTT